MDAPAIDINFFDDGAFVVLGSAVKLLDTTSEIVRIAVDSFLRGGLRLNLKWGKSHPGMGLGQLPTIASSGESALADSPGPRDEKQGLHAPGSGSSLPIAASLPSRQGACSLGATSRDGSQRDLTSMRPQSKASGTGIGTPSMTPSSSPGESSLKPFAPSPFAPAPAPQALAAGNAELLPTKAHAPEGSTFTASSAAPGFGLSRS
ncbi:unnamed protein product, partial [Prorocentrum cordatum]